MDSALKSGLSYADWLRIVSQLRLLTSSSDKYGFPFREFTPILSESFMYCSCSAKEPADNPTPRAKLLPR